MLSYLIERFVARNQATSGWQDDTASPWFVTWAGGAETDTGLTVDGYSILRSGPFWQGVNVIAGDIGRLTLRVEQADGTEDRSHPASALLRKRPNAAQRAITFKETLQAWALLWGNGSAAIERNKGGAPIGLIPLRPDRVTYAPDAEAPWLEYRFHDGQTSQFLMRDILHISGLGDGLVGYSVINFAQNTAGHNLALQKHGNRQFKNQARPAGVLETDGRMKPEARDNLRREWQELQGGLDNTGKIALLQEGVKFNAMQISNGDAQWLEARKFSREEVAAWFLLPPHKLGAMENASVRANLEEQNRDYWNSALSRWATKWEQECEEKLLSASEKMAESRQVRFDLGDLLRGDIRARFEAYAKGRQWGWLNVNEIRKKEGMPEIGEVGDEYLTPTNMTNDPSGAPAGNGASQPTSNSGNGEMASAVVDLLDSRLAELSEVEGQRIVAAASRENFTALASQFYARYEETLVEKLSPIMGALVAVSQRQGVASDRWFPAPIIKDYCETSLREVLAAVAGHGRGAWAEQVGLTLDTWEPRRRELVRQLTEG